MRTFLSILFACLFSTIIFAQKAIVKEVTDTAPVSKEKYVFPVISIPGNKSAADKINKQMQTDILDWGEEGLKQSIFEHIWLKANGDKDLGWVYDNFSYKIYSSTVQYLCLTISFVGGKHQQTQQYTYLFDTNTGDQVKLQKLFDTTGKKWLIEILSAGRINNIQREITTLKDSIQKHSNSKDPELKEDDTRAMEMFKSCLEKLSLSDETLSDLEFYIKNDRLFVTSPSCNDAWYALRLGGGVNYQFSKPIAELRSHLSSYGKKLLVNTFHPAQ